MINTTLLKRAFLVANFACMPLVFTAQTGTDSTATPAPAVVADTTAASASAVADSSSTGTPVKLNPALNNSLKKMSVGIHLGSSGIGAQYSINVLPYLSGRFEGNYIAKNNYLHNMVIDGVDLENDISVTTGFVGLFADFHSPKATIVNFTIGVVYDLTTINLVQNATANSLEVGTLTLEATINKINPYFGVLLGNTVPKKKVGVAFEIGTYYVGSPEITWEGSGIVGATADQGDIIQENVKDYSWMPVLSFHLNFKIN